MENNSKLLREIEIARLEFIGASLAALGDGILALSAGMALEILENELNDQRGSASAPIPSAQHQLDYFIHELINIRKIMA